MWGAAMGMDTQRGLHCGLIAGADADTFASLSRGCDLNPVVSERTKRMSLSMLLGTPTTATLTPRRQHSSWMALAACVTASVQIGAPGSQQCPSVSSRPVNFISEGEMLYKVSP